MRRSCLIAFGKKRNYSNSPINYLLYMGFLDKLLNKKSKRLMDSDRNLREDIFYLVSYPKSGNTWMRFLLGNYLTNGDVNFSNYHKVIPDIHRNPQDISVVKYSPVFVKSHFDFQKDYKNIIYIYRDGRDVSVSYYHHLMGKNRLPEGTSFSEYFWKYFITGKVFFGDWGGHIVSWTQKPKLDRNMMCLSYESLQNDTITCLKKVLEFANVSIDEQRLLTAIKNSTKENMIMDEKINRKGSLEHKDVTSENFRFVRKGIVGDWRSQYDNKMLSAFYEKYGAIMVELGYDVNEEL